MHVSFTYLKSTRISKQCFILNCTLVVFAQRTLFINLTNKTLFYAGEKGSTVLATRPTILFCDLALAPGESQTCE